MACLGDAGFFFILSHFTTLAGYIGPMDTSREPDDKSEGELSEGELPSDEGEVSDEGELPESEPEEEPPKKSPEPEKSPESADKFDRYKIWQEAMVNNMRSAITKVGDVGESSSASSGSDEENSAFMMVIKSHIHSIPPAHSLYLFATLCCSVVQCFIERSLLRLHTPHVTLQLASRAQYVLYS